MKQNYTKTLMKSNHRNSIDSQKISIYHLVDVKQTMNANSDQKLKSIIAKAFNHNEYYALKIANNDKQYICIETDSKVSLTEYPVCFFETKIFNNDFYLKLFGSYLLEIVSNADFLDDIHSVQLEIVSKSKVDEIADIIVL